MLKIGSKIGLAFIIFAIVACVSAIGITAYNQMYEQRRALVASENSYISGQVSSALSLWLDDQIHLAGVLARSPEVQAYCQAPLDRDKRQAAQRYLERNHSVMPYFTLINIMYFLQEGEDSFSLVVDGEQRRILNGYSLLDSIGNKSVGVGGFSFSYVKAVAEGAEGYISEAKPNAIPGLPPIYMVAVPVRGADGELLAALGFGVKLEHFTKQFISNARLGDSGSLVIMDSRGLFVGAPDPNMILNNDLQGTGRKILDYLNPHEGTTFTLTDSSGSIDYSAAPVRGGYETATPWWVLFSRSHSELGQNLGGARNWLLLICGGVGLLLVYMAYRGHQAVIRDMEEGERRKESELREFFIDATPYAILFANENWNILDVNPAAVSLFEYSEAELLERNVDELILPHEGLFSEVARDNMRGECTGQGKSGKLKSCVYDVCILGEGLHLVFFRDETELAAQRKKSLELSETLAKALTESERLRDEAERANNAKTEFLANMSHEIRTPMNAILGIVHLLLQQEMVQKQRAYAEKIQIAGKMLLGVVNSILDFSKIEAGGMAMESIPFDLANIMERIHSIFRQPFVEKNLSFSLSVAPDVPRFLTGDPLRLEQIISNLLSNALKFTEKGSVSLSVSLLEAGEHTARLRFDIVDTGIGMSEEDSKRLFKAFSQADTSTTRKYGGTGLGLVISKMLAEMMHGEILLESRLGQGSTFSLTAVFSLTDGAVAGESSEDSVTFEPDVSALAGKRVLLVEDNPINQEVASELLLSVGILVALAENGKIASDILSSPNHGFDLVLMDVQMPVMDGHDATRRIRKFAHNADLPVVAMTAHAMVCERQRCLNAGMSDHISKPIEVDLLYSTLLHWLTKTKKTNDDS